VFCICEISSQILAIAANSCQGESAPDRRLVDANMILFNFVVLGTRNWCYAHAMLITCAGL